MKDEKLLLDSIKTVGEYDLKQNSDLEKLTSKLEEIEDSEFINSTIQKEGFTKDVSGILNFLGWVKKQPWSHANHTFGYIAPAQSGSMEPLPIHHVSSITDTSSTAIPGKSRENRS
ncbi:MAG: hypothetical protein F6K17_19835 [Okeania sp. SIO3C4]|nr:hypothetical protein [Okeania sp. SIO3C4]